MWCPGSCAAALAVEAACDGPEDCDAGQECCFANFATACAAEPTCRASGNEICVTTADCAEGETCCSSPELTQFGLDGGICLPNEDNCTFNAGG